MTFKAILGATMLASTLGASAQKSMTPPEGGKAISDNLIGIFFEDISSSADGGLNAELIQNGSFEFNANERDGWGPSTAWRVIRPGHSLGYIETRQANPIHEYNPNYMHLQTERVGHYYDYKGWNGFGLENSGFDGISVKKGAKYDFSAFFRNTDGKSKEIRVALVLPGKKEDKILAEDTLTVNSDSWTKVSTVLTPNEDCKNAVLRVLSLTLGEVDVDMISLLPEDTYKGHGLRKDLAEALEALHPKFLRFPGGCVVHGGGDGFWNTYRWWKTIGPKEERQALKNTWGYHQSMALGYFEYFQLCEDMGMEPLPILPCGVSCQGANGGWSMRDQAQDAVPMSEMDEWVDEALNLIEWANGDATTKWGKLRAAAGHPKPFNLKYLGIGNEERISPEFEERFKYVYNKVQAAHPEITIVGTAGPGSHAGNSDYENGWKLADEIGLPIMDEHYYERRDYFLNSKQYDSYPRDRKTKVYLGEYAAKDKKLIDALAEALYLLHVERNADVVTMTSYAPLFARKGAENWNPDLIYFDNEKPYLTCSYYVQQMFGLSSGNYYYGDCVTINDADKYQEQTVVLDTKTRTLYVKMCNAGENAKTATIDLSRFKTLKSSAQKRTLTGNPEDENTYENHPIAPVDENVKVKKNMTVDLPAYTFVMYTIKL